MIRVTGVWEWADHGYIVHLNCYCRSSASRPDFESRGHCQHLGLRCVADKLMSNANVVAPLYSLAVITSATFALSTLFFFLCDSRQALLSKAMLVPTTVGMLQAPEDLASPGEEPNLSDALGCVYYLRALKALAFSEVLDDTMRLDMYRTMVSSVSDARHRVALEAMQCLLDHPRCVNGYSNDSINEPCCQC